jgi:hypothetical protein
MPFQYTPHRNQYVGSITDLMGRGRDAEAQALITAANAQAQAAQISGQAWGGAVQSIGDVVAKGITNWNSPEARQQRELDEARKVYDEGARQVREVEESRYVGPSIGPSIFPGTPSSETAVPFSGEGPPPSPSTKPSLPTTATYGPGTIEPYIEQVTRKVRGYLTDGGFFDPRQAIDKMVEAGISTDVINKIMSELHANNTIIASYDAMENKSAEDQTVLVGRLAATALEQVELGVLDVNAAIALNIGPLEGRLAEKAVNDLRVRVFGLSPEQQTAVLTNAVKAADDILGYTNIAPGEGRVGISGEAQVPVTNKALVEQQRAALVRERHADQVLAEAIRSAKVNEGYEGARLAEAIRSALVDQGLQGARLEEAIRAAGVNEAQGAQRLRQGDRDLDQSERRLDQGDTSQASLDAWRAITAEETAQHNREGERLARQQTRLDEQAQADRRRTEGVRYPSPGQTVTDAQGFISIPDTLESIGLTPTPPEKQLYGRINMWVTGPASGIPRSGELVGWAQETGATVQALKLVTNAIATAIQRNPRLAEGERRRVLQSLDLEPGLMTNPRTLQTRMRVVDQTLRGLLSDNTPLTDQASVLRAIDLLGVPQGIAGTTDQYEVPTIEEYENSLPVPQKEEIVNFSADGQLIPQIGQ